MSVDPTPTGRTPRVVADYSRLPDLGESDGTLADKLHRVLLEAIIDGTLPPGAHLKADGLSRRYDVSMIPAREALRTLQARGWVTIRPHQGAFVRVGSKKELDDINEMRGVVEVAAARLAAERRSPAALEHLRAISDAGLELVRTGTFDSFPDFNSEFHDAVAAASGNDVLREMQQALNQRIRFYTAALDRSRVEASAREHAAITGAIEAQDATAATELAASHLERSLRDIPGVTV